MTIALFRVSLIRQSMSYQKIRELRNIVSDIRDMTLDDKTALAVIDASAKLPSGILRGHITVFGQYKECILAKQQLPNSTRIISGSYVRYVIIT